MKIDWFKKAQNDLNEIYGFYLLKSTKVAVRICNSIIDETERLLKNPNMAPVDQLLNDKGFKYIFRSLVTKDGLFRIIYFVNGDTIFIARIWSCRKNPADLFI